LEKELGNTNDFLQEQSYLLTCWVESTLSRYTLSATSAQEIGDLAQVAPPELRDLETALCEIIEFINQLDTFSILNRNAIQKFLQTPCHSVRFLKLAQSAGRLLYLQPWLETAARVQDLLALVREAEKNHDDASATRSLLLGSISPTALGCTSEEVHNNISIDDSATLMVVMTSPVSYMENQAMLYSVLQVAILYGSAMCIKSLLEEITAPLDEAGCGHQDVLHQLIIQASRPETLQPTRLSDLREIFRELSPYQHHLLLSKDWRERYPLHYAAQHGFSELCSQIMKHMEPMAILDPDISGLTPLHLAVSSGHVDVVRLFLDFDIVKAMMVENTTGNLLHVAIQAGFTDIAKCLLALGKGHNFEKKHGWTPLYHAASTGKIEEVEALLAMPVGPVLDLTEPCRQWSPLIVASARGHAGIVKLLLQAGADVMMRDTRGWSALEHAAYRAHMPIVDILQQAISVSAEEAGCTRTPMSFPSLKATGTYRPTYFTDDASIVENSSSTTVFVNIGTFDLESKNQAFRLEPFMEFGQAKPGNLSTQYLLEISGSPGQQQPYTIQLPFLGDLCESTWIFSTPDPDNMQLSFKLFRTLRTKTPSQQLAAFGIARLDSIKGWFRPERQSLRRETSIALATPDGRFAGSIGFTFVVSTPYQPPTGCSGSAAAAAAATAVRTRQQQQRLHQAPRTQVVGHRGLGWNTPAFGAEKAGQPRRLQLGEHTVASLAASLDQGADYVEFDVQVTRDGVPVIYHDWHVSETGLDVPVHAMTFRQWMAVSESLTDGYKGDMEEEGIDEGCDAVEGGGKRTGRGRARSLGARLGHRGKDLVDRMKHTVEYARRHNKGNIRGECIHDAFTTLRELFEKFPEDVSFDIELSKCIVHPPLPPEDAKSLVILSAATRTHTSMQEPSHLAILYPFLTATLNPQNTPCSGNASTGRWSPTGSR
jgi:glycerophosphodiester phosphodiesterase